MSDIATIKHEEFSRYIRDAYGTEQWVPVYKSTEELIMFCGVIEPSYTSKSLQEPGWDLSFGDGGPGFVCHYENGKEIREYTKFDKVAANIKLEENGLENSFRNMLNELVDFLDILHAL